MIDYEAIVTAVNRLIKTETGCPVVKQNSNSPQPPYPFCSYTITSPYLNAASFEKGETLTEDVEVVLSLTWSSKDDIEPIALAQKAATAFKHTSTRQKFFDLGLAIVRIDGFGSRDNLISIQTEYRAGFDLRLRVRHSESKAIDTIETVQY